MRLTAASVPTTSVALTARPSPRAWAASALPTEAWERAEVHDIEDSAEATLRKEPTENSEPNEAALPMEPTDQTLPTESTDPSEAMLSKE